MSRSAPSRWAGRRSRRRCPFARPGSAIARAWGGTGETELAQREAQIVVMTLQRGFGLGARRAEREERSELDLVMRLGQRLRGDVARAARDLGDHRLAALAQLGVGDPEIDHHALIDAAE